MSLCQAKLISLIRILLLLALVPGLASQNVAAQDVAVQETETVERLFVARAEQPGVPLRVTSLRGTDAYEGSTDAEGQLVFRLRVAQSDEVRFVSNSELWQLDWAAKVRNTQLDPDIPLELDVGAFLQRIAPAATSSSQVQNGVKNSVKNSAESGVEDQLDDASQRRSDDSSCRDADDIQCLLRLQRSLKDARRRGDCRAALTLSQQLQSSLPDFARSDAGATELASLNFECAMAESIGELHDDRPHDRRDLLLRRAVALAAGPDGAGWCHGERSSILASAHGALRETASAAASARRARALCPQSSAPYEWEFYFRLGLGQLDRAAEVAAAAGPEFGDTGEFLRAWATFAEGECPDVERWLPAATPCTVLGDAVCARTLRNWTLRCGDESQLEAYAASLRQQVAEREITPWRLEDLAEVDAARGAWASSADLFGRLLAQFDGDESVSRGRLGWWACRQGDALLRSERPRDALGAFEFASQIWAGTELSASRLDRLVVENNVLVLSAEFSGQPGSDRVSDRLAALPDEEPYRPWRLLVENNVLELRTRADAEQAAVDPIQARDALDRLHAVESDFRRHVESVVAAGSSVPAPQPCARLVLAGDTTGASASAASPEELQPKVEDGAESEPQ